MDLIKKQTFIRADGSTLEADAALANKELILIYFSAHWCPPCKRFTPILKEFYDKAKSQISTDLEMMKNYVDAIDEDNTY